LARASDPVASKRAATLIRPKLVGVRLVAYERAVHLCRVYGTATANEIGYLAGPSEHSSETLRKRVRELVNGEFLVEAGERVCRHSGQKVTSFRIKEGT
jgi:hypothetical protein